MRRALAHALGVLALGALVGGCIMDLPTGVRVDRPRVLGVRVVVPDDPGVAQPAAGSDVTLEWLTVPGGGGWTYALTACAGLPSNQGLPSCSGEPFAVGFSPAPSGAPTWTFRVPASARGELLVAGVLCEGGTPALPAEGETLPTCEGEDATRELVTFAVALAAEAPPNRHPSWPDDAFTIDGEPLPAPPDGLGEAGCAGGSLPQVVRRLPPEGEEDTEPSELGFDTRPEDREIFEALVLGDPPFLEERREELTITHVASAGRFVRLKTEVFDDGSATGVVPWRHPDEEELAEVPPDGRTVRVWWVLRDGRGGIALAERAFCLIGGAG